MKGGAVLETAKFRDGLGDAIRRIITFRSDIAQYIGFGPNQDKDQLPDEPLRPPKSGA